MSDRKDHILIVDNDKSICWVLQQALEEEGYQVDVARHGAEGLELLDKHHYPLVIMDIMMPVMDGLTALEQMRERSDPPEIIMITAHSSMDSTVEAMKLGAFDYIVKPFDIDDVLGLVKRALQKYSDRQKPSEPATPQVSQTLIVGDSPRMRELYKILGRVASTDSSVLITGETGTGKDLFARAVHYHSARRNKPFITVNCAAIPGELLESELFGHVRGAFTGSTGDRMGKCELADGGTLFLDEIGAMRLDLQSKLLRYLQRSEFERVGDSRTVTVDVRVLAATNADLKRLVENNEFREDLYYRLMVVPIVIPPLRERKQDIPGLAQYFADHFNERYGTRLKLNRAMISQLEARDWPGNVRELENFIHRMVVLKSDSVGMGESFQVEVPAARDSQSIESMVISLMDSGKPDLLQRARSMIERPLLVHVMDRAGDNQSEAARILGVSRNTLRKMLAEYGIGTTGE